MHKHRSEKCETIAWSGCVGKQPCSGASHGGVTHVETCACGAKRRIETNGQHSNTGDWNDPEHEAEMDPYATRYHADGSVTVWNVYVQTWCKYTGKLPDNVSASLSERERKQIASHMSQHGARA